MMPCHVCSQQESWRVGEGGGSGLCRLTLTGAAGTHFGPSRCHETLSTRVPPAAASGTARLCRLDGRLHTRRAQAPVLVRSKTLEAFEHSRYIRPKRLLLRFTSEAADGQAGSRTRALRRWVSDVPCSKRHQCRLSRRTSARSALSMRCDSTACRVRRERRPADVRQRCCVVSCEVSVHV